MAYQSKTYSLSDEVVAELERRVAEMAVERGERFASPNRVLTELFFPRGLPLPVGSRKKTKKAEPVDPLRKYEVVNSASRDVKTGDQLTVTAKRHTMHSGVRPVAGCSECAEMVKKG